jgi:hypothetical protein
VKAVKKSSSSQPHLKASRIAALAKKAGRLATANRKKGYH